MARLRPLWSLAAVAAAALYLVAAPAFASPYLFTYGGRLANSSDIAVTGPVNLELKFYRTAAGGNPIGVSSMTFAGVPLEDGVFQVDVTQLTAAEMALVFDATQDTYVEVSDRTNNVTYPRQHLSAMPYAMKVPVDGKTVVFDGNGNLSLAAGQPSSNQFLTKDGSGNLTWATPVSSNLGGQTVSSSAPTNGQVLTYNGSQWVPQTVATGGGSVTAVSATSPLTVTSGTTTPVVTMTAASSVSAGYLSAADYLTFGNALSKTGGTMTGTLDMGAHGLSNLASPSAASDAAPKSYVDAATTSSLRKDGSTALTGPWAVGAQDVTGVGHLALTPAKTLLLGTYATDPTGLATADKGKIWFNSTSNQLKYWDGSSTQALGVSGAGLTNLNGQSGTTQTFGPITATGTTPAWNSASNVHTISIPLASSTSVTAGLISNGDWTAFNAKQPAGNYLTGLSGDINATGPGAATATVSAVGSSSAANIHSAEQLANAATNSNVASTLIKRDGSGNFSATMISANLNGTANNVSGIVAPANGGTGLSSPPTSGQVLIGNGSNGFNLAQLTGGNGITVSNGSGSIGISALPDGSKVAKAGDTMTGNLVLLGSDASTNEKLTIRNTATASHFWSFITDNLGLFRLYDEGASALRMVVDGNGFIGIGTSAPQAALHLFGSTSNMEKLTITNSTSSRGYSLINDATSSSFSIYDEFNSTQRWTLTSSGNVGIGSSAPAAALDVNGPVKLGPNGTPFTSFGACNTGTVASLTTTDSSVPCTGAPNTNIAVTCSPTSAMTVGNTVSCRGNTSPGTILCRTSATTESTKTFVCMWAMP